MQYNITYREKDKGIQYIISYKDTSGKWKQKSKQGFKGKREAKSAADLALEELKKEISEQQYTDIEYRGITFKKFADIYMQHEKLYREENTVEITEYAIKKFESLNDMRLDKITNLDLQRCVDTMVKAKLSRRSIINYLSRIKTLFNSAIDQYSIISINPTKKIKLPEEKETKEKIALTPEQFELLLSRIGNYKLWLITLLAGSCGMRIGEIIGLKWSDINEVKLEINVKQQYKRIGKKTEHGIGTLKTKNAYRTIPISSRVLTALKKYDNDFPRNIDGRVFNYTNTSSIACRLASIYKHLGFEISVHELRHTCATILIMKGVDFKTVAKIMGHSVQETIRTYSHVTDEMMERAAATMRSIF